MRLVGQNNTIYELKPEKNYTFFSVKNPEGFFDLNFGIAGEWVETAGSYFSEDFTKKIIDDIIKAFRQNVKNYEVPKNRNEFNLPSHYDFPELKQPTMEIINIVAETNSGGVFKIGWYLTNALKYLFRFRRKNGVADLKKARDYLDRLIDYFESEDKDVD